MAYIARFALITNIIIQQLEIVFLVLEVKFIIQIKWYVSALKIISLKLHKVVLPAIYQIISILKPNRVYLVLEIPILISIQADAWVAQYKSLLQLILYALNALKITISTRHQENALNVVVGEFTTKQFLNVYALQNLCFSMVTVAYNVIYQTILIWLI